MAMAWHVVFRVVDNRVLAPEPQQRLHLLRTFGRFTAGHELLPLGVADTHVHAVLVEDRPRLGRLAQRVGSSLQQTRKFGAAFGPAVFTEVRDQTHLHRAVRYALRQPERHGLAVDDPDLHSNLPDLLGRRVVFPASRAALRRHLPRLDPSSLEPTPTQTELDWRRLPQAAAAAVGQRSLRGRRPEVVAARAAMLAVAPPEPAERFLALRTLHPSARQRLRRIPTSPALRHAVLAQLRRRSG